MSDKEARKLTKKNEVFIEEYLKCWSGAEAARRAGYSEQSIYAIAHKLLRKAEISAAIQQRLADLQASADEVKARLTAHARGSMADFIEVSTPGRPMLKFKPEHLHLLKRFKITPTEYGAGYEIELYDAQAALVHLGKMHKLFADIQIDWRAELQKNGVSGSEVFDQLVKAAVEKLANA